MTIYGLDILLSQNLASLFFHVRFQLLLPDLHIVSQKACKVAWYSHLLKNFPKFVLIHTVKSFSIVYEVKVDVFLKFSCFSYNPMDVGNLISGSSAFSKSASTSGSSQFMYCGSLAWRILSIILLACEMGAIVW